MRMSSIILLAAFTMPFATIPTAAAWVHRYKTEEAAKKHCPNDESSGGAAGASFIRRSHIFMARAAGAPLLARARRMLEAGAKMAIEPLRCRRLNVSPAATGILAV